MALPGRAREAAMNVPFEAVRSHFPDTVSIPREELLQWIGRGDLIPNANFDNTCAIRMSMALLGAGFPNPGTWPVVGGKFKGRAIETKQRKLSNWLAKYLGNPEKYKDGSSAKKAVGSRHGIISFFHLHGPSDHQGHIDIVMMDRWNKYQRCGSNNDDAGGCYWDAVEVWFWPLR
jgi:hypothetical protein